MSKLKLLWQNPRRYIKPLMITLALLLGIHGISLWAGGGKVIDEETGKPLEGVYVMAEWHASAFNPVDSKTVCYNFAITQTDMEGRYSLPEFSWNLMPWLIDRQRYLEYYLPGYEESPNNIDDIGIWKLRRFTKTVEERLGRIANSRYQNCTSEAERKEKLVPLYRVQYDEAQKIATTPSEKKLTTSIKYALEEAEIGYAAFTKKISDGTLKP